MDSSCNRKSNKSNAVYYSIFLFLFKEYIVSSKFNIIKWISSRAALPRSAQRGNEPLRSGTTENRPGQAARRNYQIIYSTSAKAYVYKLPVVRSPKFHYVYALELLQNWFPLVNLIIYWQMYLNISLGQVTIIIYGMFEYKLSCGKSLEKASDLRVLYKTLA